MNNEYMCLYKRIALQHRLRGGSNLPPLSHPACIDGKIAHNIF